MYAYIIYVYTDIYVCVCTYVGGCVQEISGTPSCLTLSNLLALLSIQYYYNPTPIILRFDS